jgi:hypothetical protein
MVPVLQAVDDAEARGDAAGGLQLMQDHLWDSDGRIFWSPQRMERLLQVALLGPYLPRWSTSRWIVEQALIRLEPAERVPRQQALRIALEQQGSVDPPSTVMDHDWVYRQLVVWEYGGLRRFLATGATPDLVAGADRIDEWVDAPIRSLRLEHRGERRLHWTDLSTGAELAVPNLGAAVLEEPGEAALARVVPTEEGPMFDGVPLFVDDQTARLVAEDPDSWVKALRGVAGTDDYFADLLYGSMIATDVPSRVSLLALHDFLPRSSPAELAPDDLAVAVLGLARAVAEDRVGGRVSPSLDVWPCLAAQLTSPTLLPGLMARVSVGEGEWLEEIADRLVGPAATLCRVLRDGSAEAA